MQTHETRNTKPSDKRTKKKGGTVFCHVPLTMFSRYDPPILRGSSASILSLFVVWASHSSSSLCSPAQRISTMAPVPKKVLGVCATTKTARKARPSHHKGVSLDWWREERNCMELLVLVVQTVYTCRCGHEDGTEPGCSGLGWDNPVGSLGVELSAFL